MRASRYKCKVQNRLSKKTRANNVKETFFRIWKKFCLFHQRENRDLKDLSQESTWLYWRSENYNSVCMLRIYLQALTESCWDASSSKMYVNKRLIVCPSIFPSCVCLINSKFLFCFWKPHAHEQKYMRTHKQAFAHAHPCAYKRLRPSDEGSERVLYLFFKFVV